MGRQDAKKVPTKLIDNKKQPKGGVPKQQPPTTPKRKALGEALDGKAAANSGKHTMTDWPFDGGEGC